MQEFAALLYWMSEREKIRKKKEAGEPKPWSDDPVFQTTYFCNVRREDDKVTRFIRRMYNPHVGHRYFEHNIVLARFLNWPDTLDALEYQDDWDTDYIKEVLNERKLLGKVWGNAYVVTTHGIPMDKIDYLCDRVLPSAALILPTTHGISHCNSKANRLMGIEGVSTFMAGQIIADLKNTPGHPLSEAHDWMTFALPGPGSRRGMNWVYGHPIPDREWYSALRELHIEIGNAGWTICAQDLQNCLCEFDKYMRVKNGTGRSKRRYHGV